MIKVFVMQTCPDCTSIKEQAENDPRIEIIDIGEHVRNMKQFIALRDSSPAFDVIKRKKSIGIPCFVMEDGSIVFSAKKAGLQDAGVKPETEATDESPSCSIDGTGC